MKKPVVAIINYLNSMPFIYGIEKLRFSEEATLISCPPADIARLLIQGNADVGLVPVAALPKLENHEIVSEYCISSDNEVLTVVLVSNSPLNEVKKIYLDKQSLTSVNLVRILAAEKWDINPLWEAYVPGTKINDNEALVAIGDKVFDLRNKYRYCTDLALAWRHHTGLPFVFAVWAARKNLPGSFIQKLNLTLSYGLQNIDAVIDYINETKAYPENTPVRHYLTNSISYNLSPEKKDAIQLFLSKIKANEGQ